MSLYNMLFGTNENTIELLKILNVDKMFFDRFRDIELTDDGKTIRVLTRTGGGNREDYYDNWGKIRKHELYITDYDDDFDETYAYIDFKVPEKDLEVTTKLFKGAPLDIHEKFSNEIKEMDKPNTEASKRAEIIADKIVNAIEKNEPIIYF